MTYCIRPTEAGISVGVLWCWIRARCRSVNLCFCGFRRGREDSYNGFWKAYTDNWARGVPGGQTSPSCLVVWQRWTAARNLWLFCEVREIIQIWSIQILFCLIILHKLFSALLHQMVTDVCSCIFKGKGVSTCCVFHMDTNNKMHPADRDLNKLI